MPLPPSSTSSFWPVSNSTCESRPNGTPNCSNAYPPPAYPTMPPAGAVSNSSPLPQTQQGGVGGSSNISRVFPVKKPHMSPIFIEDEPKESDIPPQQMPELIADQHAIKKSGKIYFMLKSIPKNLESNMCLLKFFAEI